MDPNIRNLNYENRLDVLGITCLEHRRLRGDLIQMYKMGNNLEHVNLIYPKLTGERRTRGHRFRYNRELIKGCDPRHNFLVNRICHCWNQLPIAVAEAPNLNIFKTRLDNCFVDVIKVFKMDKLLWK